jgi:hypothetical protein
VGFEDPLQSVCLFGGVALLNRLLARRQVFEFGQHLKELLDFAGRLVGIDDLSWGADGRPRVLDVAWYEYGFTSSEAAPLFANLQLQLAVNDVNPVVLVAVEVARPSHCATGVLSRHLAINRRAVAVEPIIEPVFSCANAEAHNAVPHSSSSLFLSSG